MLKSSEYCLSQTMAYPSGKLNGALPRQERLHHHRARQLAGEATRNLECPVSSFPVLVVFHQKVCDRPYVFILSLFHPVPPTMPLAQLTSLRAGRLCTIELRDSTPSCQPPPPDSIFDECLSPAHGWRSLMKHFLQQLQHCRPRLLVGVRIVLESIHPCLAGIRIGESMFDARIGRHV